MYQSIQCFQVVVVAQSIPELLDCYNQAGLLFEEALNVQHPEVFVYAYEFGTKLVIIKIGVIITTPQAYPQV